MRQEVPDDTRRTGWEELNGIRPRVRLRTIALPVEHGGWGFLGEPILLGLLVAPTAGGVAIGVMTVTAFLLRHPLKLTVRNRRRLAAFPRFRVAARLTLVYGLLCLAGLSLSVALAGLRPLLPFLLLAPALAVYAAYDMSHAGRHAVAELAGTAGLAAAAPAIALAGGWDATAATALWLVLLLRAWPSVAYVRARLRLERGGSSGTEPARMALPLSAHAVALALAMALYASGLAPRLTVAALAVLGVRATAGLSTFRRRLRPQRIGVTELLYGLGYVAATALGYRLGI